MILRRYKGTFGKHPPNPPKARGVFSFLRRSCLAFQFEIDVVRTSIWQRLAGWYFIRGIGLVRLSTRKYNTAKQSRVMIGQGIRGSYKSLRLDATKNNLNGGDQIDRSEFIQ
jgi:hypothetical protein